MRLNYYNIFKITLRGLLLWLVFSCWPGVSLVEAQEERASIQIQADKAIWDKKNNLTILRGNVVITRKGSRLEADLIKAFGRLDKIEKIIGEGGIRIIDYTTKTTITGGYIEYDHQKQYGFITLNPVLKQEEDNLQVNSTRMEYSFIEKEAVATGEVEIYYRDLIARGSRAVYSEDGKILLTGKPSISKSESNFSGDQIIIYTRDERLEILGNVKGSILTVDHSG